MTLDLPPAENASLTVEGRRSGRWLKVIEVLLAVVVAAASLTSAYGVLWGDTKIALLPIAAVVAVAMAALAFTRFSAFVLLLLGVRPILDAVKISGKTSGTAAGNTVADRGLDPSALVVVLFLLAAVLWFAARVASGAWVQLSPLSWALLAFLVAGLLSVIVAIKPQASAMEWLRISSVAAMFLVLEQLITSRTTMMRVIAACYVGLLLPVLYTVGGMVLGYQVSEAHSSLSRLSGPFNQSNIFARYLAFLVVFAIAILPYVGRRWRLPLAALTLISIVFMALSVTLTAILGTALAVVLIAVLQRRSRLLISLVAAGVLALTFLPGLASRLMTLDSEREIGGGASGSSLTWRFQYWAEVLPLANRNPWAGIGLTGTQYLTSEQKQPHNDFIRAYVETGVVGLVAYVAVLVALVVTVRAALRRATAGTLEYAVAAGAAGVVVAFIASSFFANVMSNVVSVWYVVAFVAAAGFVARTGSNESPDTDLHLPGADVRPQSPAGV